MLMVIFGLIFFGYCFGGVGLNGWLWSVWIWTVDVVQPFVLIFGGNVEITFSVQVLCVWKSGLFEHLRFKSGRYLCLCERIWLHNRQICIHYLLYIVRCHIWILNCRLINRLSPECRPYLLACIQSQQDVTLLSCFIFITSIQLSMVQICALFWR